jgi:periplasmic divalent cation tolerance protein
MPTQALLVLTTLGSADEARNFVTGLVADRLVACGTVLSKGTSIYWWEGAITEEDEVVVLLKTDASKWDELSAAVEERHPYEVPELLAVPVEAGLERYLAWLTAEVTA